MPYEWKNSPAKEVLEDDFQSGMLPLENTEMTARQAWDLVYSHLIEFHGVSYDQYYQNFQAIRKRTKKQRANSGWMVSALQHDRQLHPRKTKNACGKPVFDKTKAKEFLKQDVKDGKHKRMKPRQLQKTRKVYMIFRLDIFRQRIYQEVRAQKFNFYLELKRVEKQKKRRERRQRESQLMHVDT